MSMVNILLSLLIVVVYGQFSVFAWIEPLLASVSAHGYASMAIKEQQPTSNVYYSLQTSCTSAEEANQLAAPLNKMVKDNVSQQPIVSCVVRDKSDC